MTFKTCGCPGPGQLPWEGLGHQRIMGGGGGKLDLLMSAQKWHLEAV